MKKRQKQEIILVDDDTDLLEEIAENLELANHAVTTFSDPTVALEHINQGHDGIIISDVRMPNLDGHALLDAVQKIDRDIPFVMITGHGQVTQATTAMKAGAYDFLEKPIDPDQLHAVVGRALEKRNLHLQNERFKSLLSTGDLEAKIIGTSKQAQQLRQQVSVLASLHVDLIIKGETGTGKDLVSRMIHDLSERCAGPYVVVNAAQISAAHLPHIAKEATGGTLLLDEICACPLDMQPTLLRLIDAGEVMAPDQGAPQKVDLRIIAATNEDTDAAVKAGRLRADLLYRLDGFSLDLPPLRDRRDDIALIATRFLQEYARLYDIDPPQLGDEEWTALMAHEWPGNVRELRNLMDRRVIMARHGMGSIHDALAGEDSNPTPRSGLREAVAAFERQMISKAIQASDGRMDDVANELGIGRRTLNEKIVKLGLDKDALL